jgi:hypothetical protein
MSLDTAILSSPSSKGTTEPLHFFKTILMNMKNKPDVSFSFSRALSYMSSEYFQPIPRARYPPLTVSNRNTFSNESVGRLETCRSESWVQVSKFGSNQIPSDIEKARGM